MDDIKIIRENFRNYLEEQVKKNKLSKINADTQWSDADYPRKHADELGINYWQSFKNINNLENLISILKEQFEKEGKNSTTIKGYEKALKNFMSFIEEHYNGVNNMFNTLSKQYYWVCQGHQKDDKKYILAPVDNIHHHKRVNELKIGDIVVNYFDQQVNAISIVEKSPEIIKKENNDWYKVVLDYKKLDKPIPKSVIKNIMKTNNIKPFKYGPFDINYDYNQGYLFNFSKELLDLILGKISEDRTTELSYNKIQQPLNQILYGPPGTGKTYNTILKAMSIIDNTDYKDVSDKKYSELKNKFDKLKQAGQIEFVTFHQSYSYEEFVEGIKPNLNNEKIGYKLEDGIFKQIVQRAKQIKINNKINFFEVSLGSNWNEKTNNLYSYCIENNVVPIELLDQQNNLYIKPFAQNITNSDIELYAEYIANHKDDIITRMDLRKLNIVNSNKFKDFFEKHESEIKEELENTHGLMLYPYENNKNMKAYCVSPTTKMLERFSSSMQINDIVFFTNENNLIIAIGKINGEDVYDDNQNLFKEVKWFYKGNGIPLRKIYNNSQDRSINIDLLNHFLAKNNNIDEKQSHILILDEINRGNISKIFGELITLIEEDKRENLTVTLPYSQEEFTVPKNLYIIGTMNTSDRSIASIDIALRRRFKFVEMMPNSNLVADFECNFKEIFKKLNTKIKILLDRDHQIGHSYFIKTKYANANIETLKEIWFSEIIPLLNEYFYCDWDKLKLIIPGFIKEIEIPQNLKNECEEIIYEFKTSDEVENFLVALNQEKFE